MLDSQNKERRRQETHYYASEVGILASPARIKADFGLFRPFRLPADTTRYGYTAQFQPNQPGSARIKPSRCESQKKKKLRSGTNAQATASDSGVAPSQPRLCFLDINTQKGSRSVLFFIFFFKKGKSLVTKLVVV